MFNSFPACSTQWISIRLPATRFPSWHHTSRATKPTDKISDPDSFSRSHTLNSTTRGFPIYPVVCVFTQFISPYQNFFIAVDVINSVIRLTTSPVIMLPSIATFQCGEIKVSSASSFGFCITWDKYHLASLSTLMFNTAHQSSGSWALRSWWPLTCRNEIKMGIFCLKECIAHNKSKCLCWMEGKYNSAKP